MANRFLIIISGILFLFFSLTFSVSADHTAGPNAGIWDLTGKDVREWKAVLVITASSGSKIEGYFIWKSVTGDTSNGYEPFEGVYNPDNRQIILKGMGMQEKTGRIATGSVYEATLSEDGMRLSNGRWFGENVSPGTWGAYWKSQGTLAK